VSEAIQTDIVGAVLNGRRVIRDLGMVLHSMHGNTEVRRHSVMLICERCGDLSEVTMKDAYACGCVCASSQSADLPPEAWETEHQRLLAEAGQRCPAVWRALASDDDAINDAIDDLIDLLGPLDLCEIAALLGVTYQRVQQVAAHGLKNMRRRLRLAGVTVDDLRRDPTLWEGSTIGVGG
jgi:hypothetical protein